MNIFRYILTIVMIMAANAVFAQQINDRDLNPSARQMAEHLGKSLKLTDEQVDQIIPIFEAHLKERKSLYTQEKRGANKKMLRKKSRELIQKTESELSKYITPEQRAAWKAERL